jgi:hypothetical protein
MYIHVYIYIGPFAYILYTSISDLLALCVSVVSKLVSHWGEAGSVCDRKESGPLSILNK